MGSAILKINKNTMISLPTNHWKDRTRIDFRSLSPRVYNSIKSSKKRSIKSLRIRYDFARCDYSRPNLSYAKPHVSRPLSLLYAHYILTLLMPRYISSARFERSAGASGKRFRSQEKEIPLSFRI